MPLRGARVPCASTPTPRWWREGSFGEGCRPRRLAVQFRQVRRQTGLRESRRDTRSQSGRGPVLFLQRVAKDVPDFFLHAAPMALGAALQARLNVVFQMPNNELGHGDSSAMSDNDIMISNRASRGKRAG